MTTDPIQAAIDALEALDRIWDRMREYSNKAGYAGDGLRFEDKDYLSINDALEKLRAHQSEVAALKEAVLDLGMFIKAEAATCAAIYNEHAATIKAAGGA